MPRPVRILTIAAGIVLLLIAGILFFVNANQFRPMLVSELQHSLGRDVRIGDLKLSLISGGVKAADLAIADDPAFSRSPFITAESLKVGVEWLPLIFSHRLHVTRLTIDKPEIVLIQLPSGQWNFSSIGSKAGTKPPSTSSTGGDRFELSVEQVKIASGRVTVMRPGPNSKPNVYDDVNVSVAQFSPTAAFPFSVAAQIRGGGDLRLEGQAGPVNSANAANTPLQAMVAIHRLDPLAAGFVTPTSGLGGLLTIDAAVRSDGNTVHSQGTLKGEQLKLARGATPASRPVQMDFAIDQDIAKRSGVLRRGDLRIGKAVAALSGTWVERVNQTDLNARIVGRDMPISDLETMLPALDIVLPAGSSLRGGVAHADLTVQGRTDALVTSGSLGVSHTTLAGFDLGSRLATIARLAGMKATPDTNIESLSANIHSAPDATRINALTLIAPELGELGGEGVITSSHALDFRMLLKVHSSGLLSAALGRTAQATIPFFIRGTSSSPSFVPDVKSMAETEVNNLLRKNGAAGSNSAVQTGVDVLKGLLGGKKK